MRLKLITGKIVLSSVLQSYNNLTTRFYMKVSIAMASYNGASYIKEQLESFLVQTRLPDELVITDDCSSDDTIKIIKEFANKAPFPVLYSVNENNLGYAGNFNAALEKTTGDLVFLSDQDDVWFPEKLEYMTKLAEQNPDTLIVMNDAALTDGLLNEVGFTKIGQIKSTGMTEKAFVMGCCCAVRRELLDICMPIPATFKGHDNWLVGFADGLKAKKIASKVLQYYRRHESNESQFIANRTVKITRKQVFAEALKGVFNKETQLQDFKSIEQIKILAEGIKQAKVSNKHAINLSGFLAETEEKAQMLSKRIEIRSEFVLLRIPMVLAYLAKGGYTNTSGLKAVIRDLMGYPGHWFSIRKPVDFK